MKKPIVRNWTRYWAGTLAISGMLVMGACDSDTERTTADETTTETSVPAREDVSNRDLETEEDDNLVADGEMNTTSTVNAQQQPAADQTKQTTTSTSSSNWSGSRWSGSSVSNIDKHVEKFSEVNEAIEQSLSELAGEGDANNMAQQDPNMQDNQDMAREDEQTGVTYDNMSNQDVDADEQTDDLNTTDTEGSETEETDQTRNNMVNTEQQSTTYEDMNNVEGVDADDVDNEANAEVDVDAEVENEPGVDVDADAEIDVETDANTATGIDVDADADMDADVETGLEGEDTDVNMETEEAEAEVNMETEEVATEADMQTDLTTEETQDQTAVTTDRMSNTSADFDDMFDDIEDTEQYNALELARMNPNLSTFVSMVEQAGLTAVFEGEGPVTIFAPTNQAFEELSQERQDELSDPAKLAEVLNLHVLAGEEASTAILNSRSYIDRGEEDGVEITTELDGTVYIVGGARIIKSDVEIANGVLHVVDGILETSPDAGPGPGLD